MTYNGYTGPWQPVPKKHFDAAQKVARETIKATRVSLRERLDKCIRRRRRLGVHQNNMAQMLLCTPSIMSRRESGISPATQEFILAYEHVLHELEKVL